MTVACLTVGSKLAHDGAVWTVVSLSGESSRVMWCRCSSGAAQAARAAMSS